jgi:predicted DNA-binding transcriptional regulator YafY
MGLLRELQRHPSGRHYKEIARDLGFSERTAYRDLHALKGAGWPVQSGPRAGFWRLDEASVPGILFTPQELTALALARQMATGMPGSPFERPMESAFQKIKAACDRDGIRVLEASDRKIFASLRRSRPYTRGQVWFANILSAMQGQETIRMVYFTRERGEESKREVDPYGLVFHEGAFYLVGFCHQRKEIRTFLVDRIRVAQGTGKKFEMPADFSASGHFRNAWGILRGKILVKVRARFDRSVAQLVREGRWHQNQRLEDGPGGAVILSLEVAGWEEIKRWLLGFGSAVEVLEPAELRESMASEAGRMGKVYRKRK